MLSIVTPMHALTCCYSGPTQHLHNNLGVLLFQQGHAKEALKELEKAVALAPGWEEAVYNLQYVRSNTA